jgi:hypothetical protein
MHTQDSWQTQFSIETSATAEAVWKLFQDVPGWKNWNAGIESIELEGPFASGSSFTMKPPGQDPFRSMLTEVRENECFVDETEVGPLVIRVAHRIERLGPERTRITYAVDAQGAQAAEIGPAVSADFPEVLAALASLAERATQGRQP